MSERVWRNRLIHCRSPQGTSNRRIRSVPRYRFSSPIITCRAAVISWAKSREEPGPKSTMNLQITIGTVLNNLQLIPYHTSTRKGATNCNTLQLEEWCPPDVTPVILSFNYETNNASAYKFNTLESFLDYVTPISHLVQIYWQLVGMRRNCYFQASGQNSTQFPKIE